MSTSNKLLLTCVKTAHCCIVYFIVTTPFTKNYHYLIVNNWLLVSITIHWKANNNACCLTLMEHKLRQKIFNEQIDEHETFMGRIITPIYDVNKNYKKITLINYFALGVLFIINSYSLYKVTRSMNFTTRNKNIEN